MKCHTAITQTLQNTVIVGICSCVVSSAARAATSVTRLVMVPSVDDSVASQILNTLVLSASVLFERKDGE